MAIQIHSLYTCAVGETHGDSSTQLENCNECCRFGSKFCIYFYIWSRDKLQDNKHGFIKHLNEKLLNEKQYTICINES